MTDETGVPESLHEWLRLNDQLDELEEQIATEGSTPERLAEVDQLARRIVEAWNHAPLRDRGQMSLRLFAERIRRSNPMREEDQ